MSGRRDTSDELQSLYSPTASPPMEEQADHLISAAQHDRWPWRRKIRASPIKHRIYRVVVGFAGLLLIVLGLVTGPIPGPGGIPLILLGLATWASEFAWAHRLMHWFKAQLRRFQQWTRWQQVGFWVAFVAFCGLCGYSLMVVAGVPPWVPASAEVLLERLPGL